MSFELDLAGYRLLVALATFLAAVHAWRKLSPYFSACWFGSGLVFGWCWAGAGAGPEAVLLPVLVIYQAAAVTKGLVETRPRIAGNHVLHVLMTGVLSAALALPWEAAARAASWPRPRVAERELFGIDTAGFLGGLQLDLVLLWCLVGIAFYGAYKLLDHSGLSRTLQTLVVFGVMPFLVRLVSAAHAAL